MFNKPTKSLCVDIKLFDRTFRYSNRKIVRSTVDEDGQEVLLTYLPYLLDLKPPESKIDIDGFLSTSNIKFEIVDYDRQFTDSFYLFTYESATVDFYFLDENQVVIGELSGYLTDTEYSEGVFSATARFKDDSEDNSFLKVFTQDDFQYQEILNPRTVNVQTNFTAKEDTPWTVFKTSYRFSRLVKQVVYTETVGGGVVRTHPGWLVGFDHKYTDPPDGLPGGSVVPVIKLGTVTNTYLDYEQADATTIKVINYAETDSSGNIVYEITDGVDTISAEPAVELKEIGETDEHFLLRLLSEDAESQGIDFQLLDVEERLYIAFDPSNVTSDQIDEGYLGFYYDPDTAGSESIMQPVKATLFDTTPINSDTGEPYARRSGEEPTTATTPYDMEYFIAVLGNAEYQGSCERVAYLYCMQGAYYSSELQEFVTTGDDNYYLSGIPNQEYNDPAQDHTATSSNSDALIAILAFDDDISTKSEFLDKYGVTNDHIHGEIVAPYGALDKVYISSNGLTPSGIDDPELGVGFVNLGGTLDDQNDFTYLFFHRYKLNGIYYNVYDDNKNNGTMIQEVLELEIHVRPPTVDPAHSFTAGGPQARWELYSADPELDSRAVLGYYEGIVNYIDFHLTNIPDVAYTRLAEPSDSSYRDAIKDRYRGLRLDMIGDTQDFKQTLSKSISDLNDERNVNEYIELNNRLLNNANGKFAVCIGSEIVFDGVDDSFIYERLYFAESSNQIPERVFIPADTLESTEEADDYDLTYRYGDTKGKDFYLNYLTYKPQWLTASEQENNWDLDEVEDFFVRNSYRVIHDPVPENSQDLGKYYPIVYGYVEDIPALQVVSKKTFSDKFSTAGDDIYIIASHQPDIASPTDIKIRLYSEVGGDLEVRSVEDFSPNLKFDVIENPFPNVLQGHYIVEEDEYTSYPKIIYSGDINTPYHQTDTYTTLSGDKLWGFKLEGDKWDARAGKLDRRYPIRNGVGNSNLYVSFGGWVDKTGEFTGNIDQVIEHPCDVIKHFLKYYGEYPISEASIDTSNLDLIKSKTRKYRSSILLNKPMGRIEFIKEVAKQFGFMSFDMNGASLLAIFDEDDVRWDKPLSEGFNLLNKVSEKPEGYKTIYNEIEFKYDYNYPAGKFDKEIRLDKNNNRFCAKASRARGGKQRLTIEADFIRDHRTAQDVARRLAKFYCRKRIVYTCRAKYVEGFQFVPGEFIPMTYSPNSQNEDIVMVSSVTPNIGFVELEVVKFV